MNTGLAPAIFHGSLYVKNSEIWLYFEIIVKFRRSV
jgi:hypothetical protein